jgi:hypothetical protein
VLDERELLGFLGDIENVVRKCVDYMPPHRTFIEAIRKAGMK